MNIQDEKKEYVIDFKNFRPCKKCFHVISLDKFGKYRNGNIKLICKGCEKNIRYKENNKYYLKHKEQILKEKKEYYKKVIKTDNIENLCDKIKNIEV